jgi:hypothetical protein
VIPAKVLHRACGGLWAVRYSRTTKSPAGLGQGFEGFGFGGLVF